VTAALLVNSRQVIAPTAKCAHLAPFPVSLPPPAPCVPMASIKMNQKSQIAKMHR
jgi:hypothetical protein